MPQRASLAARAPGRVQTAGAAKALGRRIDEPGSNLLYTEISDVISQEINNHYARLFNFFQQRPHLCDQPLFRQAILSHLPRLVREELLAGADRQRRRKGYSGLARHLPHHRGLRPAHGRAQFWLPASGDDAGDLDWKAARERYAPAYAATTSPVTADAIGKHREQDRSFIVYIEHKRGDGIAVFIVFAGHACMSLGFDVEVSALDTDHKMDWL